MTYSMALRGVQSSAGQRSIRYDVVESNSNEHAASPPLHYSTAENPNVRHINVCECERLHLVLLCV